jgi:methionyl-tRNA synthetase
MREVNFGADGQFSEEAFISRFNSDLANDLGNLLNRTLTMVNKYCNGVMPEEGQMDSGDRELLLKLSGILERIDKPMLELKFNQVLIDIWQVINSANKHIEVSAPWQLKKEKNQERLDALMHVLLKVLCHTVFFIYPFMPRAALKMADQLGMDLKQHDLLFSNIETKTLKPGRSIRKPIPIFPRIA